MGWFFFDYVMIFFSIMWWFFFDYVMIFFFDYVMNIFSFGEPEFDYKTQDQLAAQKNIFVNNKT